MFIGVTYCVFHIISIVSVQNMKVRIIVIYAIPLKKNIFIALDIFLKFKIKVFSLKMNCFIPNYNYS